MYPDKLIFKVLCGSQVTPMQPLTARSISEMPLIKNALWNELVVTRPYLIHHSTQERLANSQNHSLKKISIWKFAKGKKNWDFLTFL